MLSPLYFGLAVTLSWARLFNLIFGAVYELIGVVGFPRGNDVMMAAIARNKTRVRLAHVFPEVAASGNCQEL
ncbi:MAG: hypothetical protein LC800_13845 [Acidobacteria bacterium]|nr:hypothetical protein [Acidobacteriota bacterium]